MFVEIMSEMRDPREFKKSIFGATSVFCCVYFTVAIVGYYYVGSAVINPITANLSSSITRRFVVC